MTAILGISAFYHDSAAALVVDGEIVAAAQEERFTRKKHDHDFPTEAIEYCLREAGLAPEQLDYVGFYDKPLLKFERLLETYLAYAPAGFRSFLQAMPLWLKQKLYLPREMRQGLGGRYGKRFVFTEHHESHAASAFFPSPFEEAAILTLDGVGEWATASFGIGRGNRIELHARAAVSRTRSACSTPRSPTSRGFKVNSGEYKLMGLAPYGEPRYADLIRRHLIDLKDDGSFRMDMSYFNYCQGLTMTSPKFDALFGGPPRHAESPLTQREMDIAASIQEVTEEIMLRMRAARARETGHEATCAWPAAWRSTASATAASCAKGRSTTSGFSRPPAMPAARSASPCSSGISCSTSPRHAAAHRSPGRARCSARGTRTTRSATFLDSIGAVYQRVPHRRASCATTSPSCIAAGTVVGWFQGRMEFGPRALGSRSILGDARSPAMQSVMNLKIKFRESFRPFAPSVLQERVARVLRDAAAGGQPVHAARGAGAGVATRRGQRRRQAELRGIDKLKVARSSIPAITHVDYSARVQTVDPERHGRYYALIKRFERKTGCPVIINTSFNVRGEPIVCRPAEAYRCFMATNMDVLVLERFVLRREAQPNARPIDREEYLARFELD